MGKHKSIKKSVNKGLSLSEARTSTISKRRAGAELKDKLKGTRSDGMGKYTATVYGLDKDGKRVELKSMNDLNKYSKFELGDLVNEGKEYYVIQSLKTGKPKYVKDVGWKVRDNPMWVSDRNISKAYKYKTLKDARKYLESYPPHQTEFWHIYKMSSGDLGHIGPDLKESVNEGSRKKVNENINPEVYKSVDRFIKALATKYGYEDKDAVFAIQAALKEREYNVDVFGDESINEDMDLGHKDNEPHMLKKDLYRIAKYAAGLYKMVNQYDSKKIEVDFPHWWQSKIIQAKTMLVSAKHYLDGELTIPQIDDALGEALDFNDPVLVASRAAKMRTDKILSQPQGDEAWPTSTKVKKDNSSKIAFLEKERDQLMMDMEQEAEPEGGPIADRYGTQLNRIDKAIAKLSGRKEMTYDQAIK